ncbi:hypothetical protein EK904_014319 [Melospiza melodia maxima]|nr:hypothetical protein EK904_014319 [Melospiza melodia maxima]
MSNLYAKEHKTKAGALAPAQRHTMDHGRGVSSGAQGTPLGVWAEGGAATRAGAESEKPEKVKKERFSEDQNRAPPKNNSEICSRNTNQIHSPPLQLDLGPLQLSSEPSGNGQKGLLCEGISKVVIPVGQTQRDLGDL